MLFIPVPKKYPSWRHYRIKTNHLMNGCVPRREHCVSWESQCRKFLKKRVNIWTVSFRREFRLFKMFSLRFLWSCTGQRLVSQMRANFLSFSQKCLSLKHHWNYNCRSHFVHSDRCFKTTAQTLRIARTDGEKLDSKWWQIWVTCSPN